MSPVKVYGITISPPVRTVLMTAEVLGLEYELVPTNPLVGETRTPEFLKLNPQHNIPVIVDGDFVMNESRAAIAYLVTAHGKEGNNLYPADPKVRAVVDQRLYFDMGTFYKTFADCFVPILFGPEKGITPAALERFQESLGWFRDFVKTSGYAAGTDHVTVADLSFLSTYECVLASNQIDLTPYQPELNAWYERCKAVVPNYEKVCVEGAAAWAQFLHSKIKEKSG